MFLISTLMVKMVISKMKSDKAAGPPGKVTEMIRTTCATGATMIRDRALHRGSFMSAHVLLNVLNELGKRDKMRGLPSILSLFRDEFDKFNNTRARMLDSIYHMTLRLL